MKSPISTAPRKPSFRRAFIPFWIALVWAAVVFSWDYHVRQAALTRLAVQVSVEGTEPDEVVSVEVNGRNQRLRDPVPVGFSKIRLSAPDCEPEIRERFIWYGITDLGAVDLVRSRGNLTASILPAPDSYELTGKRGSWTNTTGGFIQVPVGRYDLVARFGPDFEAGRVQVDVKRQQTSRVDRTAGIGSLELSAEPSEGEFELIPEGTGRRLSGNFPTNYARMRAGAYRLIAKRPGYERELRLDIEGNETNRLLVKFLYGAAEILTTPEGAMIFLGGNEWGKSPRTLNRVVPGTYQIEARLPGYDISKTELIVEIEATNKLAMILVNTQYREAMEGVRKALGQDRYGDAVGYLEAALKAQPDDAEATRLLPGVRLRALRNQAEVLANRGEFDAALKVLDTALAEMPGDATTAAQQKTIQAAKADYERRASETQIEKLIADAKREAAQKLFNKAFAVLEEAKKLAPNNAEIAGLESLFQRDRADWIVESLKKNRQDQFAAGAQEFQKAWQKALSEERDASAFPLNDWTTSKSVAEVRAALGRVGKSNFLLRNVVINDISVDHFTAKMGEMLPGFTAANYVRIGVEKKDEGVTHILMKMMDYSAGAPESDPRLLKMHIDRFLSKFAAQLDNDLR